MNDTRRALLLALLSFALTAGTTRSQAQWTPPTAEELSMTSQPEVPGAPAVYLFREEITNDKLHEWIKYARIKVLTERGKEYANVELHQYQTEDAGGYAVSDIEGRTIHPDGTIIPFTGKAMEKLVERTQGYKEQAKVFTLPSVEIGSIIEFRYKLRYDDNRYIAPSWFIQSELYTRKAHYLWQPTDQPLVTKNERGEQLTSMVAWTPILPKGYEVKQSRLPGSSLSSGQANLELNIHDIAPLPQEEYMPPIQSFTYRVLFYYSPYRSPEEYWKNEGKSWARMQDRFIGPGPKVKEAVGKLLTPAETTDEAKLRKLYAAVMELDNTAFSRSHTAAEEKAQGLGPAKTDDIWERKRGSDDQIAELFIAMARAAGYKASAMIVTDRDRSIFAMGYLNFSQLNDVVAVVNAGGKDLYFDPGQRYCAYGHLSWKHSMAQGLRQADGGAVIAGTPQESFSASRLQRVANLTMNGRGEVTGDVKMTFMGSPALRWRQSSLRGDNASLQHELRTALEHQLPGGMEVKVGSIVNLEDYEKPLTVTFTVKGPIGSSAGKRLLVPSDIFEANATPTFPHEKRELPIYFEYPHMVQDAMRITFPSTFAIESTPAAETMTFEKFAGYQWKSESTPTSMTVHTDFELGNIFYKTEEYAALRAFYGKVENKRQEPTVLKTAAQATASN